MSAPDPTTRPRPASPATPGGSAARLVVRAPQSEERAGHGRQERDHHEPAAEQGLHLLLSLFRFSTPEQRQYFRSTGSGTALLVFEGAFCALGIGMALLLGFWMVVASTIAVFGSYKPSELRAQVREAQELGRYRLKQKLGAGGMGEVYLAEHVMLKQECAIKLIRPERAGDPTALQRFEREVQATSRLKSWHTVQIFDYGHADDGTFYYVMEYLPGLTLEELVRREGPLHPARAVRFLRQMCAALREAHGMGLIHRDIKPANIIAGMRGGEPDVAKLLDFGLVRHAGEVPGAEALTMDGAMVGTPAYMSPEQVDGRASLDERSDIYSLGAVGYYLLAGRPPFVGDRSVEVLVAHARDPVPPLSGLRADVPPRLEAVILRCLEKEPAARWPAAAELDAALAGWESGAGRRPPETSQRDAPR